MRDSTNITAWIPGRKLVLINDFFLKLLQNTYIGPVYQKASIVQRQLQAWFHGYDVRILEKEVSLCSRSRYTSAIQSLEAVVSKTKTCAIFSKDYTWKVLQRAVTTSSSFDKDNLGTACLHVQTRKMLQW